MTDSMPEPRVEPGEIAEIAVHIEIRTAWSKITFINTSRTAAEAKRDLDRWWAEVPANPDLFTQHVMPAEPSSAIDLTEADCACTHSYTEHASGGGACRANDTYGVPCECPAFERDTTLDGDKGSV